MIEEPNYWLALAKARERILQLEIANQVLAKALHHQGLALARSVEQVKSITAQILKAAEAG